MSFESGLPDTVAANELLVRFAWQSNQFKGAIAKPQLFMPHRRETSVYRREEEPAEGLVASARTYEQLSGKRVRALAFVKAGVPQALGLSVAPDEPPSHHAIICGWFADEDLARAQNDELAMRIAAEARVVPFGTGS